MEQSKQGIKFLVEGEGFPIVLLHGYLETQEIWNGFKEKISHGFKVITFDLPGHGKSPTFAETHTMETVADKIDHQLKLLKIEKCLMVGHSMGGYVTLAFVRKYPEMLSGWVLFHSAVFADTEEKREHRMHEMDLIIHGRKKMLFEENIRKMYANENQEKFKEKINETIKRADEHDEQGIVALLKGMMSRPDSQDLARTTQLPALFIFGKKDNYIPVEAGNKMSQLNKDIKVEWLEHSGHNGFIEQPHESLKIIRQFAQECMP